MPPSRGEAGQRRRERDDDGRAERPVEELRDRAETALVRLGGLELVEDLVDLRKLGGVACAKVAAARLLGDRRQRCLVEICRRVDLAQSEQRAHGQRVGADADRIDDELPLRRELGSLARLDGAGRVRAVREKQQHAPALRDAGVLERADREADGIADRGLLTGQADDGLVEQRADGLAIERQRGLEVRFAAEQDQADAIADAPVDEVRCDGLQRRQPVDPFAVQLKILLLHAAREIDGQQQVTARHRQRDGLADELRPRGREHRESPDDRERRETPALRRVRRTQAREIGELRGDGGPERRIAVERLRPHDAPHEPRQR